MRNRIENLGDYNQVRLDLQAKGGDLDAPYNEVSNIAVSKAATRLMLKGGGNSLYNM